MLIIRCDYHPSGQQVFGIDTESGEIFADRWIAHTGTELEEFYGGLPAGTVVGVERGSRRSGSCGPRRDANCWKVCGWNLGRRGGGTICCAGSMCSTAIAPVWSGRSSRRRKREPTHGC